MILHRSNVALLFAVAPILACDDPARPDTHVGMADISTGGVEVSVIADDGAVRVDIMTWGSSCTTYHHDEVDVDDEARVIRIRPYNEEELGVCFMELVAIPHAVRVDPEAAGAWVVRVIGRGLPASVDPEKPQTTTVIVEREITIPS